MNTKSVSLESLSLRELSDGESEQVRGGWEWVYNGDRGDYTMTGTGDLNTFLNDCTLLKSSPGGNIVGETITFDDAKIKRGSKAWFSLASTFADATCGNGFYSKMIFTNAFVHNQTF